MFPLGGGLALTVKNEPGRTPRAFFLRRLIASVSDDDGEADDGA